MPNSNSNNILVPGLRTTCLLHANANTEEGLFVLSQITDTTYRNLAKLGVYIEKN